MQSTLPVSLDLHHLMATYDAPVTELSLTKNGVHEHSQTELYVKAVAATLALMKGLFELPVERSTEGPIACVRMAT